jgi:hypothetical protein
MPQQEQLSYLFLGRRPSSGDLIYNIERRGAANMRKRTIASAQSSADNQIPDDEWLDLEALADVEVTSEDSAHPIESALLAGRGTGWRAAAPGKQTIRLLFARPQRLKRIWLSFVEPTTERTQEYALRWSADGGQSYRDIVRQQWNFSPRGATSENEDHRVDLPAVTALELSIVPNTSGGNAVASLAQLRVSSSDSAAT